MHATAAISITRERTHGALLQVEVQRRGCNTLRPAEQRSRKLARVAAVVVDSLFANKQQRRGVAPRKSRKYVRYAEWLDLSFVHHVRGTVSAQSQGGAQHVACARWTDGDCVHTRGDAALFETQCLFKRNLAKRIHRELDAFEVNALQETTQSRQKRLV